MMLALEMYRSLPRHVAGKAIGGRVPGLLVRVRRPAAAGDHRRADGATGPAGPGCGPACPASAAPTSARCPGGPASTSPAWCRCRSCPATRSSADLLDDCEDLPGRHPRRHRPGADLRRARRRAVRGLRGRGHQPVQPDHRRPPGARAADRLLHGHRRRLGRGADRAPQPAARRARGLLRRAGRAHRADGVRGAHRAAGRRRATTTGCWSAAPARSACSTTLALRSLTDAGRDHGRRQARAPAELALAARRHRGGRARRGAAPAAPGRPGRSRSSPSCSPAYLLGGVDVAVDAVGSKQSLETALHATRAGGRVVLSGMPQPADLSAAWFRELEVVGTYASSRAEAALDGRSAFDVATELLAGDAVGQLAKTVAELPAAPLARGARPRARRGPARHGQGGVRPEEQQVNTQ